MAFKFPSHKKSVNSRREWRANQKDSARARHTSRMPVNPISDAERMNKSAAEILSLGLTEQKENGFRVWCSRTYFYDVTVADGNFSCYCADQRNFDTCAHIIVAQTLSEKNQEKNSNQEQNKCLF